jgi:hypothetical protein
MTMILGQTGSSRCCCGPCRGFPAFDGSSTFYKYLTLVDEDCCNFGPCTAADGKDGRLKFKYNGCWYCEVVEATGNYGNSVSDGSCIDCCSLYPVGSVWDFANLLKDSKDYIRCGNYFSQSPGVINATTFTAKKDKSCCNSDGSKIYWQLSEPVDASEGTGCGEIGACCGGNANAPVGGYYAKTTCRMMHECECNAEEGATWHGAGSSCLHNPCGCCEGFRAFDGSSKWYRYARIIDTGTCEQGGYLVAKWVGGTSYALTATCQNIGQIVEAEAGTTRGNAYPVGSCIEVPTGFANESSANSATYRSGEINADCGNPIGDKLGWLLYDEIQCTVNPLP